MAVLGGTNVWQVSPNTSDLPLSSYVVSSGVTTSLSTNQAFLLNFAAALATNHISGIVKDNSNQPITNLNVSA